MLVPAGAGSSGADEDLLPLQVGSVTAASLETSDIDLGRAESEGVALAPIFDSLHDAVVVTDAAGVVLLVNDAFTRLVGWRADEGPFRPPYPWWPADQELAARGEFELHSRAGTSVWVSLTTTTVAIPGQPGVPAWATTLRDVTAERAARARRAAAADLAGKFATAHDLTAVVITAVAGFQELFDGDSVVEVATGDGRSLFTASGPVDEVTSLPEELLPLPEEEAVGGERLDALLIRPRASEACRAWVRFPTPRVVSEDEVIVGSLLAEAFGLAVDRVTIATESADRVQNLQAAVESHRRIGQAIGILVERHRLTPRDAFARLSKRSQDTNVKVRDLAARLVETGLED